MVNREKRTRRGERLSEKGSDPGNNQGGLTPFRTASEGRAGFAILETMLSMGFLLVALVLVAQVAAWSLSERERTSGRQEALEQADNILEQARALPWEGLTPQWAAAQKLPEPLAQRLFQGKLTVSVQPEAARPRTRRVTVAVHWKDEQDRIERSVQLVGLFSARSTEAPGGKP